jgi:hypothetical protein
VTLRLARKVLRSERVDKRSGLWLRAFNRLCKAHGISGRLLTTSAGCRWFNGSGEAYVTIAYPRKTPTDALAASAIARVMALLEARPSGGLYRRLEAPP